MSPDASTAEPGKQVSSTLYTIESVPSDQRGSYWRRALSHAFAPVDLVVPGEVCSGTVRTSRLGHLQVATVKGDLLYARRTPRLITQDQDQHLVVKLLVRGAVRVEQDAREVDLRPGEIVFCDMARPMQMEFRSAFQTKSLVLPRSLLGLGESNLRRLTARAIRPDTTLGSLLSPVLTQFVDTAATYRTATGEVVARHVVDLLTVLVGERLHDEAGDAPHATRVLLTQVQAFIDRHLADSDLTPQTIAKAHYISVRYLHRLFEAEGVTVARWVQQRRLQECRRELARRASADRTIAAVAHAWGFTSAVHFSRVFRSTYGMSPAEWRDPVAQAPPLPSAVPRAHDAATVLLPQPANLSGCVQGSGVPVPT
ncbi:AraC-like ligand-binding domain-containing protein [Streptomyces sp. NPDC002523]